MDRNFSKFRIFQIVLGVSIIIVDVYIHFLLQTFEPWSWISSLSIIGLIFIFSGLFYKKKEKISKKEARKKELFLIKSSIVFGSILILIAIFITIVLLPTLGLEIKLLFDPKVNFHPNFLLGAFVIWGLVLFPWILGIGLIVSAIRAKVRQKK